MFTNFVEKSCYGYKVWRYWAVAILNKLLYCFAYCFVRKTIYIGVNENSNMTVHKIRSAVKSSRNST